LVCDDNFDDDRNGLVDCQDPNCASFPSCGQSSNACDEVIISDISCGQTISDTTAAGASRMHWYGCREDTPFLGPEVVYRFVPPVSGIYHVSTTHGEVIALTDGPRGCDPAECLAMGAQTSFLAGPTAVTYLVVDGVSAGDFALTVTCPAGIVGETLCDDGKDNDGDQTADCDDPDCATAPACGGAVACVTEQTFGCGTPAAGVHDGTDDIRFYQCDEDLEPMPYSETVLRFDAPHAGNYRFWLNGDGGAKHELVLLGETDDKTCSPTRCDTIGPELLWVMGQGESVYIAVEGPPGESWSVTADCPAPPDPSVESCDPGGTLQCEAPLILTPQQGGPSAYSCDSTGDYSGPQAVAQFTASTFTDLALSVSAVEGPPADRSESPWSHVLLKDQGAGCATDTCIDDGKETRVTLQPGETVYVVADSGAGDEVTEVTFNAECSDPFDSCLADESISCGGAVLLAPQEGRASAYLCQDDGKRAPELITGFYGPEAAVWFEPTANTWVTFAGSEGDIFLLEGSPVGAQVCDPTKCSGLSKALTRQVKAGQRVYAVLEVDDAGDSATISAKCHDPTNLGACTAKTALKCGQTSTLTSAPQSDIDVYSCGGDVVGGYYGREVVASFTAENATTVTFDLPAKSHGFLLRDDGQGCRLEACEDDGESLTAVLEQGETVYVVVDSFNPDPDESALDAVSVDVSCASPFGQCQDKTTIGCGETVELPVTTSNIAAYLCGDPSEKEFVGGQTGAEAGLVFTAPEDTSVRIATPEGDMFLVTEDCGSEQCHKYGGDLDLQLAQGTTVTLIADSDDPKAKTLTVAATCVSEGTLPPCEADLVVSCGDKVAQPAKPSRTSAFSCPGGIIYGDYDGPELVAEFVAEEELELTVDFDAGVGLLIVDEGLCCHPMSCADVGKKQVTHKLQAGQKAWVIAESSAAAPIDEAQFSVSCKNTN